MLSILVQNGKRAKLEAADGNEIDTMFMDKRTSGDEESKGNTLVRQWCELSLIYLVDLLSTWIYS